MGEKKEGRGSRNGTSGGAETSCMQQILYRRRRGRNQLHAAACNKGGPLQDLQDLE